MGKSVDSGKGPEEKDEEGSVGSAASDGSDSDSDYGSDDGSDEEDENEDGTYGGQGKDDTREFLMRDEAARDFQGSFSAQGGVGGNGMRTTVRNLRLREDTPKYLRNLALDSAFYDPKSRSMRLNPLPDENPEDLAFAGDNFVRYSGDAVKLAQNQVLCWEMQARGEDIDVLSNPSQAEMLQRQFKEKKQQLDESKRRAILSKYLDDEEVDKQLRLEGVIADNDDEEGSSFGSNGKQRQSSVQNKSMDPRLRLGQTELYVEYARDGSGRVERGPSKPAPRTKYDEDQFTNNHTSIWGSYYHRVRQQWGYRCCHSLLRNSYCTGAKGKEANDAANGPTVMCAPSVDAAQARKMLQHVQMDNGTESANGSNVVVKRSDIFGENSLAAGQSLDKEKMAEAIRKAEEWEKAQQESRSGSSGSDVSKKRALVGYGSDGYNSMKPVDVTTEDMEVYRLKRLKEEDPMLAFMGGNDNDGTEGTLLPVDYKSSSSK